MTTDSALSKLIYAVTRIKELSDTESYSKLAKARALPGDYTRDVAGLRVDPGSSYGGRPSDHQQNLADRLKKRMVEEERARGEQQRDELLAKYAAEIEGLRAALPALAASASIELGVLARALDTEARSGATNHG